MFPLNVFERSFAIFCSSDSFHAEESAEVMQLREENARLKLTVANLEAALSAAEGM